MSKKRKLTTIRRRLASLDNVTSMQRCQLCNKPTMHYTGRCAACRKQVAIIAAKIPKENALPPELEYKEPNG